MGECDNGRLASAGLHSTKELRADTEAASTVQQWADSFPQELRALDAYPSPESMM